MADDLSSRSLFLTVVEVGSLVILNILSLTGNTLVCISVYKNARLRTTTNLYIIALALSDLLSAIFVMPLATVVLIKSEWVFSRGMCDLLAFFGGFVINVSPVTMGVTAFNRYMRICKSDQQYKKLFSPWKSRILLGTYLTVRVSPEKIIALELRHFFKTTAYKGLFHGYLVVFGVKTAPN